jgi:HK97 family phage portal protein
MSATKAKAGRARKRGGVRAVATAGGVGLIDSPAVFVHPVAYGRKTASGERVSPDGALTLSTYWACLNNISQDLGKIPLELRRRRDGRGSDEATEHPAWRLLRRRPNPLMGPMQFRMVMQHRLLSWGNAYAEIVRDGMGRIVELWPIHPVRIKPVLEEDGRTLRYEFRPDGKTLLVEDLSPRDILHLRGMGSGIEGYSVLQYASESLGLGLAAQRHAAAFYGEGMAKRLVAVSKVVLSPKGRQAYRERLKGDKEQDPVGQRKLPFLEGDISLQDVGVPPDQAQFLESRTFSVPDVARWFRMALAKIQHEGAAKGWNSLEVLNRDYATDALEGWGVVWEEECWLKLLSEAEQAADKLYFRHRFQALLKADFAARMEGYVKGIVNGWLSQNDVRELEDMEPIDDPAADVYRQQAQMQGPSSSKPSGEAPPSEPPKPPAGPPEPEDAETRAAALRPVFTAVGDRMARIESNESTRAAQRHTGDAAAFAAAVEKFRKSHARAVAEAFAPVVFSRCILLSLPSAVTTLAALEAAYLALPAMGAAESVAQRGAALAVAMAATVTLERAA